MGKTDSPVNTARIVAFVHNRRYRPMTAQEMAGALHVQRPEREKFFGLIEELQLAGELVEVKKRRLADPARVDLMVGTLLCNPRGFGFVRPARESEGEDIYVPAENMSSALHGDLVVVRVPRVGQRRRRPRGAKPAGAEAKVESVIQRARTEVVGTFLRERHVRYVVPDDPRLFRDVVVAAEDTRGARARDKVCVRITIWPTRHLNPAGKVVAVFGPRGRMAAERQSVIREFNLRDEFPRAVLRAAERLRPPRRTEELAGRTDLTSEEIFTIDPEDARDFDDAVSLRRLDDGGWQLGVHIADVSHYLKTDGPIDHEAGLRGTSVYLPGQVIPMLPETLSNDICSLKPDEPRLAKTVRMRFDASGRLRRTQIFNSVIRSVRRFTYKEAQSLLEGGRHARDARPLSGTLLRMHELAERLRACRREAGMIEIDVPEAHILADDRGRTTGVELRHSDAAHRLIEQFMLAANEAVARHLIRRKLPYLCRAHDEPEPRAIEEFRETAQVMGYRLPRPGTRQQIQRFLARMSGKPEAPVLHYLLLRSMKPAEYSAKDEAHWAIGARHYLHFTSPIRRYPDLLVHRILDEAADGRLNEPIRIACWKENLPVWAAHATTTERNAQAAERTLTRRRLVEFVAQRDEAIEALITGVENYGLRVNLRDYLLDGVVRLSDLSGGFYRVERGRALVGTKGRQYRIGRAIRVRVKRYDEFKRSIEFEPAR